MDSAVEIGFNRIYINCNDNFFIKTFFFIKEITLNNICGTGCKLFLGSFCTNCCTLAGNGLKAEKSYVIKSNVN